MAQIKKRGRGRRPWRRSTEPEHLLNDKIEAHEVRIVGDNLESISESVGYKVETGVFKTRKAIDIAANSGMDLILINPKAVPPVCKIIDYKKFLYQKKKKDKELKAKTVKTVVKEIRFGPNTDDHDFDFKLRHAKKFLEDGSKVKAYVHFRGRSIVFKDRGELLLLRFIKELEELGGVEYLPKLEGRRMTVIISPKKK